MKINGEKGQALPLVIIAVILGAFVVTPFVNYANSSIIGSKTYGDSLLSQYASDSGVEHAIWGLTDGDFMDYLTTPGSSINYVLDEELNGMTTNVTVCNSYQPLVWDDFESGDWAGGGGWLDDWSHEGNTDVTSSGGPYEGSYHLRLRGGDALVSRHVDLSHQASVHLRFWGKISSFEWGDEATCQVSSDGIEWHTLYTFTIWDDTSYYFYDFDLSSYEMTSQFWIRFDADMSGSGDYLYIDKLDLIWLIAYPTLYAWDDFESGDWSGGGGWTDDWTHSGYADVLFWWYSPYEGWWHLRTRGNNGDVQRATDLSGATGIVHLRFYAKVRSFESSDTAVCQISPNGSSWTTLRTFTSDDDDNTYHPYDFDLSPYQMTSEFWIRFDNNGNNSNDYLFVDKIEIVSLDIYGITAVAGDTIIKAQVMFDDEGNITVLAWYFV